MFQSLYDFVKHYYRLLEEERWGVCREATACSRDGDLFHPRDDRCYPHYSQGPCPRGQLLAPSYPQRLDLYRLAV